MGIIGPSGAGKSSLARLMVAAALPSEGRMMIGDLDSRRWQSEALAAHVGYLPQSIGLLQGSVRDNIARHQSAGDDAVVRASRRAHVHEMIMALPQGCDTQIGEGGLSLSGGERQRIALARALFGDPRLLVLDEPNAHLDAAGEKALVETLAAMRMDGVTVVLIAHRLDPLAHVDRVLLLDFGELRDEGAPKAVIASVAVETVRCFSAVAQ